MTAIMPSKQKESLRNALDAHGGLKHVATCLSSIDVNKAEATRQEDATKVRNAIISTVGVEAVNQKVRKSMVEMALKECVSMLTNDER